MENFFESLAIIKITLIKMAKYPLWDPLYVYVLIQEIQEIINYIFKL